MSAHHGSAPAPFEHPAIRRFDDAVDAWFEAHLRGRRWIDRLFFALSAAGDWSVVWHVLGWALTLIGGPEGARQRRREALQLSIGLGLESAIVNGFLKSRFRRERPNAAMPRPHHLRTPRTSSFPSGHASAAAFTATTLTARHGKAPAWWGLGTLVAASRIHVRIHHASDVVGGAIIGAALGRVACHLTGRSDSGV